MKMNDDISGKLKSIASTSKGVSKEFEALQNRADALGKRYADFNQQAAKTAAEALDVKRSMDEAAKAFKETGDEADRVRFQKLREEYQTLTDSAKTYSNEAKKTQKAMWETYDQVRKLDDGSGKSGSGGFLSTVFGKDLGGALAASGIVQDLGSSVAGAFTVGIESAMGQPMAAAVNSTLSGVVSGASAGAIAGLPGMAVGAVLGGAAGLISGGTQAFEQRDDAFKSYVQDAAENALSEQESGALPPALRRRPSGSWTPSRLTGCWERAWGTVPQRPADPGGGDPHGIRRPDHHVPGAGHGLRRQPGPDAGADDGHRAMPGSAVGVTASDMTEMAQAMSRMNSSGKATLEYLNIFQDRAWMSSVCWERPWIRPRERSTT